MVQVIVNVPDEVKALGDAMLVLAADIKAKKSASQIIADTIPGLLQGLGGLSALGADVKTPAVRGYLALVLEEIVEASIA